MFAKSKLIIPTALLSLVALGSFTFFAQVQAAYEDTFQLTGQITRTQTGTATIKEVNGEVEVVINVTGFKYTEAQPAHFHTGATCDANGPIKYPLSNVVDGKSTTRITGTTLAAFTASLPLYLNIHESATNLATVTSCGVVNLPTSAEVSLNGTVSRSQAGTVMVKEVSGKVQVMVTTTGYKYTEAQPAHLHTGATCDANGPIKYPLTNVVDGKSTTTLDVDAAAFAASMPLYLNVHESATNLATVTSCGVVPTPKVTTTATPTTTTSTPTTTTTTATTDDSVISQSGGTLLRTGGSDE